MNDEKIMPKVASATKTGKYLTIVLMAIVTLILLRGFLSTPDYTVKKTPPSQVQVAENDTVPINLNVALEKPTSPQVKPEPSVIPPPPSVLPKTNLQLQQNNNPSDDLRTKSPSLVYTAKDNITSSPTTSGNLPGSDSNNLFAQQAANSSVVTVTAQRNINTNYKILQGKLISAVLETAINSDLPGMVRAVVNQDVYSDTGKYILLSRGTRLIGQYNSAVAVGQTRVMVMWTRAITPNHVDIALGSPSADSLGESGMAGSVDNHFWKIFGTSALLSVLGAGVGTATVGNNNQGVYGNPYQTAVTQGVLNTSNTVLQSRINIQPTIEVPQGTVIQVFVARDLDFSTVRFK